MEADMKSVVLRSDECEAVIRLAGAECVSYKKQSIEYLWQANPQIWARTSPVLFPIVGRLLNNTLLVNGNTYAMNQHGFARDMEFLIADSSQTHVSLFLDHSEHTLSFFPFQFSLNITYTLIASRLICKWKVVHSNSFDMYFSIGAHPGFLLPGGMSAYFLQFDADHELDIIPLQNGLVDWSTRNVMQLNRQQLQLSKQLFLQDALVIQNPKSDRVSIVSQTQKPLLTMQWDAVPFLGIWSPKGCDQFVCIEPWHGIADSIAGHIDISQKAGINRLLPKEVFTASWSVELH